MTKATTAKERKNMKFDLRKVNFGNKFTIILWALFLFLLIETTAVPILIQLNILAHSKVQYIAFNVIGNDNNVTALVNKILYWENVNMVETDKKEFKLYPCIRVPTINPFTQDYSMIALTECGKCGEFAEMFSTLAYTFNIENRIIEADSHQGGNHAWIEIIVNNTTIPIDPTSFIGYNATQFYQCSYIHDYYNIRIRNGENVTARYYSWCS